MYHNPALLSASIEFYKPKTEIPEAYITGVENGQTLKSNLLEKGQTLKTCVFDNRQVLKTSLLESKYSYRMNNSFSLVF